MDKEFIEALEKSSLTFMVAVLNDIPFPFLVSQLKLVKINGKECLAFASSDCNVEVALSTDSRIYGLSLLQKEKKVLRFTGRGLVKRDEEILKIFGKESNFIVLIKIENLKEESFK